MQHEEIKDEIKTVVRPNFKSQINGQNLQDVLIDMVTDYSDDLQNIRDTYATTASLLEVSSSLEDHINSVSSSLDEKIENVSASLDNKIDEVSSSLDNKIESVSASLNDNIQDVRDTYATTASLNGVSASLSEDMLSISSSLDQKIDSVSSSLNDNIQDVRDTYATTESLGSVSASLNDNIQDVRDTYASTASVNSLSASFDYRIDNVTASITDGIWRNGTGSGSAYIDDGYSTGKWRLGPRSVGIGRENKAEGDYAFVGGENCSAPGDYSHAEGWYTTSSGDYSHTEGQKTIAGPGSHAEGYYTKAGATYCHAEGKNTEANGDFNHAEGDHTVAQNPYEHAQGRYNATASAQLFSVGVGALIEPYGGQETEVRKNAISIITGSGPHDDPTADIYVLGIGGYDGTNPEQATPVDSVVAGMSSSLSSVSASVNNYETWTFILEDSSSVTKSVLVH